MSLDVLTILLDSLKNASTIETTDSYTSVTPCDETDLLGEEARYVFYQLLVVPSFIEFIIFSFLVKRKSKWLDKCWSRPGIVFPMDIYETRNRFSFVAAFIAISHLCFEVILDNRLIIQFSGDVGVKVFVILLSVICYGLIFFPIFASLTLRSTIGYLLGSLHCWVLMFKGYNDTFGCHSYVSRGNQFLLFLMDTPKLIAITYLAITLPIRFIMSLKVIRKIFPQMQTEHKTQSLEEIRNSPQGRHVRKLLQYPMHIEEEESSDEGCKSKAYNGCKGLLKPWIYKNNPEFKYSARILAIYVVCFIIVYKPLGVAVTGSLIQYFLITYVETSLEYMYFVLPWISNLRDTAKTVVEMVGWVADSSDSEAMETARRIIIVVYYTIDSIRACFICATIFEIILTVLLIFHMISSYRKNLLGLYKGSQEHIPPKSGSSNSSIMVGTMRYTGYQIGYIMWAYIIQWFIFFLVFTAISFIIALFRAEEGSLVTGLIGQFWPVPVTTVLLIIVQRLLAKYLFLQDNGNILAIENRRGFFLTTYFSFFYNIFLGVVSCFLRIGKAIVIGALFLGRLDHSTLPRRFQLLDPGFDAYVGFMHMENAHFNPMGLTFIALLQTAIRKDLHEGKDEERELGELKSSKKNPNYAVAIRWQLAGILHYNPQLRVLRKSFLDQFDERARKLRIAKSKKSLEGPVISADIPEKSAAVRV